ncbi:MAG TPA: RDD family protein [Anaerolineae bacterium]|nr:RDD family protein [Anaerolineae bacterium]
MHRLAGVLLDLVVLDFIGLIVYGLVQGIALLLPDLAVGVILLGLMGVVMVAYTLFGWVRFGRTPGMMAVGLRLVNAEGAFLTWGAAIKRLVVALLPLPGLSLFGLLPSLGGQIWHDRLAQTSVIRD